MKNPTFKFAFKQSLPIMAGFLFLGATYGIYMHQEGFNFLYPTLMAATIFGGSIEFVVANLLLKSFDPWLVFFLTLVINSRHLFYGLSMLDRYKGTGKSKLFLIFGMCDESFSINFATHVPNGIDQKSFMVDVTILNYLYWVTGAFLGGVLGGLIPMQIPGISFVMTALFIVLFMGQFITEKSHFNSIIGIIIAIISLLLAGPNLFLPVSMFATVVILWLRYRKEEKR